MKLSRLLAVGRSLIGGKKEPAPYKLPQENWLPKFAANTKPSAAPNKKVLRDVPGESKVESGQPKGVIPFQPQQSDVPNATSDATSASETGQVQQTIAESFRPIQVPPPKRNSILKNLLAARSAAKTTRPFVQAELGLDGVRVVRNDLRDADVEVRRTAQPGAKADDKARNPFAVDNSKVATDWSRVSAHLLETNRPRA